MTKLLLLTTSLAGCLLLAGCGPTIHDAATRYPDGGPPRAHYSYYFEDEGDEGREEVRHGPYQELHENGQLKAQGRYVDGERSGKWVFEYENGRTKSIGKFEDDQRTGEWTFFRESGEKRASGPFEDGRRVGGWTFWTADGERHARVTYGDDGVEREHFDVSKSDSQPVISDEKPTIGDFCKKPNIRAVVSAHADQITSCYQRSLNDDSNLKGKVLLQMKVGLAGEVTSASVVSTTMNHDRFEGCIVGVAETMQFDPPSGGMCIINYPFAFSAR